MKILLSPLFAWLFLPLLLPAQYRELAFGGPDLDFAGYLTSTSDGGFLLTGNSKSFAASVRAYAVKINSEGEQEWQAAYGQDLDRYGRMAFENPEGGFTFISQYETPGGGVTNDDLIFMQIADDGTLLSETVIPGISFDVRTAVKTPDGHFVLGGNSAEQSRAVKISPAGMVQWSYSFGRAENDLFFHLIEDSEGNLVFTGVSYLTPHSADVMTVKLSAAGTLLWETYVHTEIGIPEYGSDVFELPNGNYLITGTTRLSGDQDFFLLELNREGGQEVAFTVFEQEGDQFGNKLQQMPDGGFVIVGDTEQALHAGLFDLALWRLNANRELVWQRQYGGPSSDSGYEMRVLPDTSLALMGSTRSFGNGNYDVYFILASAEGLTSQGWVSGVVANDSNMNCLIEADEQGLSNWLIRIESSEDTLYALTNAYGQYAVALDTGQYRFRVVPPNDYWLPCEPVLDVTVVPADTTTVIIPVLAEIDCPALSTSVQMPDLQPCQASSIRVFYCNSGTVPAEEAYVEVTLDSALYVFSASLPWSAVNGNRYTFELGDIPVDTCAFFSLFAGLSCEAAVGQAIFASAHIYPDTNCLPPSPEYTGAFLETAVTCLGDSIRFQVTNTGIGDMAAPLEYVVIEDAVLFLRAPLFLPEGATHIETIAANGPTYFFKVPQEPGAPGSSLLTALSEGCGSDADGLFSTGFANQFPHGDLSAALDLVYEPAQEFFWANGQTAYPEGYGFERLIEAGTTIEYRLFFHNTGYDTLYQPVFLNTLSDHADIESLRLLASSHPCEMRLSANGQVQFVFSGVLIPPFVVNAQAAFCFVSFQVRLRAGLLPGTTVENSASLQIDFDKLWPLGSFTHTIGADFVLVALEAIPVPEAILQIYPNPFRELATLEIKGVSGQQMSLEIYDLHGRLVEVQQGAFQSRWPIHRRALPPGAYFFQLRVDGKKVAQGRLLAY